MNSAIERLLTLRVKDVMTRTVVTVSEHDSMADAARVFVAHAISGAPVLDAKKSCAGMLSAFDFVKHQCQANDAATRAEPFDQSQTAHFEDVRDDSDRCRKELVRHHMTATLQCVPDDNSLLSAARIMGAQHVHRLPVLDKRGQAIGILTSLDIVAALVNAIEE